MKMRLNETSIAFMEWAGSISFIVIGISQALILAVPYFFVRRYIRLQEPKAWQRIKTPLLVALLPLLMVCSYWFSYWMSMAISPARPFYKDPLVLKIMIFLFLAPCIFAFTLWYRSMFSQRAIRIFITGIALGFILAAILIFTWMTTQELILRSDPAYVQMLEIRNQRQEERNSQNV